MLKAKLWKYFQIQRRHENLPELMKVCRMRFFLLTSTELRDYATSLVAIFVWGRKSQGLIP